MLLPYVSMDTLRKIVKIGNSAGIVIPSVLLRKKNLKLGDKIVITIVDTQVQEATLTPEGSGTLPATKDDMPTM